MVWSVYMVIILILSICTLLILSIFLSVRRDFFFIVLYLQVVIYLHLAPTFASFDLDDELKIQYVLVKLACLLLFEIPLLLIYIGRSKSGNKAIDTGKWFHISLGKQFLLSASVTVFAVAFLFVTIQNGLIYRRLGIGTPIRLVSLSLGEHFIYRLFMESGIFLTSVLLFILLASSKRAVSRLVAVITLIINGGIYALYALINSRLESLLLFIFIAGVILRQSHNTILFNKKTIVFMVGLVLFSFYALRIAGNIRLNFPREGVRIEHFNPFYRSYGEPFETALEWRLNGLDLMARITPSAVSDMFARGKAWEYPIVTTFGFFFNRSYANELKLEMMTTAKRPLMLRYTSIDFPDYPSCMLTDAYGNFGPFGLLLVAFFLGIICRISIRWFSEPHSASSIVVGLFILSQVLQFEHEFAGVLFGLMKGFPVLLLVLFLNPLRTSAFRE